MAVGDSFVVPNTNNALTAIVDSISTISYQGRDLKQWHLTKYCDGSFFDTLRIVENVGPINDYLVYNLDGCMIGGGTWEFSCHANNDFAFPNQCEPLPTAILNQNKVQNRFRVYPNPSKDILRISGPVSSSTGQYQLLDMLGKVLLVGELQKIGITSLDISNLPTGSYHLVVQVQGFQNNFSVIKQE